MIIKKKFCIACKTPKCIALFDYHATHKDGRRNECKDCTSKRNKNYYKTKTRGLINF